MKHTTIALLGAALLIAACGKNDDCPNCLKPGSDDTTALQQAFIDAKPGSTIELAKGTFHFTDEVSLQNITGVTVKGQGTETTLDFSTEKAGANGLSFQQADGLTVQDLAIKDTPGDAIRIENTTGVTVRGVTISWTAGSSSKNGAYGVYPVTSSKILVEKNTVSGASDTGVYVGQSHDVIVQDNDVFGNVAGIEIENTTGAEVRRNHSHGNAAGILVFNLPKLPVKNGHLALVHDNVVEENNHDNFAAAGNIVSYVPSGIGMLVTAADQIEIRNNTIKNNVSAGAAVASFATLQLLAGVTYDDPAYDPFPETVSIHDNTFVDNGKAPAGLLSQLGGADVLWDGAVDPAKTDTDGSLRICAKDNGAMTFLQLGLYPDVPTSTDASLVDCTQPPVPPVQL